MSQYQSFDIFVLGLKDPSKAGRARFSSTMERLTGRPRDEFQDSFPSSILPVFECLEQEKVVGWFQGRMEFGPRALGSRSIIGDPRSRTMMLDIEGFSQTIHERGYRPPISAGSRMRASA